MLGKFRKLRKTERCLIGQVGDQLSLYNDASVGYFQTNEEINHYEV